MKLILRLPKPRKLRGERVLRTYRAVAREWHDCQWCCVPIFPGDQYEGRVVAAWNRRVRVDKHHVECPPDPDGERASREVEWHCRLKSMQGDGEKSVSKKIA
jgi:hypothetical protein